MTLIISPSGNYYGSEQVLHEYLISSKINFHIWLPNNSVFMKLLIQSCTRHKASGFNIMYVGSMYIKLFYYLLIKKYNVVYLNEGGHIKYINILSKIFKSTKFVIHIRIIEDCNKLRWPKKIGKNVTILSISKYIQSSLPFKSKQVYDIYKFDTLGNDIYTPLRIRSCFQVGIIGRVTLTKGLEKLVNIIEYVNKKHEVNFVFNLYGDISNNPHDLDLVSRLKSFNNVVFWGFEKDRSIIYRKVHCILHCSVQEALGRIFIESIDCLKPFIGFNEGGIGEIGESVGLSSNLIDAKNTLYAEKAMWLLLEIRNKYYEQIEKIKLAKEISKNIFNASIYLNTIDDLLQ